MARLIGFLLVFAIFLAFIGLNLENYGKINFGFHLLESVPVYVIALCSFFFGMICTIPFILSFRGKKQPKPEKEKKKPGKKNKSPVEEQEEIPKEIGPYGID